VHGEHRQVVHGIADELLARIDRLGGLNKPHVSFGKIQAQAYDTAAYKCAADDLLLGHSVEILFHALGAGVVMDRDDTIRALIVETKSGRAAVIGRMFIDCSGDGDLAAWAGAPFEHGDGHGGMLYPTMMFRLNGVDPAAAGEAWTTIPALMDDAERRGVNFPRKGAIVRPQKNPIEWRVNVTQMKRPDGSALDGTNALPAGSPDDVAMALSFAIGLLSPGQTARFEILLSEDGASVLAHKALSLEVKYALRTGTRDVKIKPIAKKPSLQDTRRGYVLEDACRKRQRTKAPQLGEQTKEQKPPCSNLNVSHAAFPSDRTVRLREHVQYIALRSLSRKIARNSLFPECQRRALLRSTPTKAEIVEAARETRPADRKQLPPTSHRPACRIQAFPVSLDGPGCFVYAHGPAGLCRRSASCRLCCCVATWQEMRTAAGWCSWGTHFRPTCSIPTTGTAPASTPPCAII
jgi:hypothetical protein